MKNYSPKSFFRKIPSDFLQQYFQSKNLFLEFDFSQIPKRKAIDTLVENLESISKPEYDKIDKDFRNIFALGNEGGILSILEVSQLSNVPIAKDFELLEDSIIKSFWCFLKFPDLFKEAFTVSRYYYDSRYWRKIIGLPKLELQVEPNIIKILSQKISAYFFKQEGRGRACQIEHYNQGDLQFFFAFPE
ncbi:MAG: hypothetical protein KDK66_01425, partial [Deltaproteobacteria bacterium]|nr:hypothetical protein [Deltaproteobacteria bacterium]